MTLFDKLLAACTDKDPLTEQTIRRLALRYRLADADLIAAWEAAMGPGVLSPTRVAVSELRKRGEARTQRRNHDSPGALAS